MEKEGKLSEINMIRMTEEGGKEWLFEGMCYGKENGKERAGG